MPDPIRGSDIPVGTPSAGDSLFSIDGGNTRRFLIEAVTSYIAGLIAPEIADEVADGIATNLLDGKVMRVITDPADATNPDVIYVLTTT